MRHPETISRTHLVTADDVPEHRRVRAAILLLGYSMGLSRAIERVVGSGSSGNHEVAVLTHLRESGPCRPGELALLTGLSRSGVAGLVDRLQRERLVVRQPGERDLRTVLVALTASGRRRIAAVGAALNEFFVASAPIVEEFVTLLGREHVLASVPPRAADGFAMLVSPANAGAVLMADLEGRLIAPGSWERMTLGVLYDGPTRPKQIGEAVGLSSGRVSVVLDQLEAAALIARSHGRVKGDRRSVLVTLTDRGRNDVLVHAAAVARHADPLCAALVAPLGRPAD
jgi:DNA-binding MarR family transcriptional regulator